ncbi:MAG: MBL fold metallo-hydrolase [archaeon]|nr:MBL fold metallo-hydrolase [archaeon]
MAASSKVSFFGGVDEIGGNKIIIEDKGTRIVLDFGKSFKARSKFYDWNETPRVANGIGDFIAMGLLPDLGGIYREDMLALAGRSKREDPLAVAFFLSHAHADHLDYVSFLREDLELYMGETTKRIVESLEYERGTRLEFEITGYKRRPLEKGSSRIPRKINTFVTGSKIQIDSIEVEPIHVDHSIPGCYGFVVRTSKNTIVYSGDLRIHGNNPSLTRDFIERAAAEKPDVMICEGTRIDETSLTKEKDVFDVSKYFVERSKRHLVYADYSYKDIDRFTTFYNVAKSTGRALLIHAKVARYLKSLSSGGNPLKLPSLGDENILIYKPREKSGVYHDHDYSKEDREIYEGNQNQVWTAENVKRNPSKVIIALGSYQIDQLVDISPTEGLYLHSSSEPFNEEGELSEEKMKNWLDRFGLQRIHLHCSGHASGRDLNDIVSSIQPRLLIPIHTEHGGLFKLLHGLKVKVPELTKEMEI